MIKNSKKAFTIVEILVCLAILSGIIGVIISMMTRGASNVQKGSFTALAANQSSWIVSVIRNDIARSDVNRISFSGDEGNIWKGESEFKVAIEGGTASYAIEKQGKNKRFVRRFTASGNTAFEPLENKVQYFGDEYLSDMTVTLATDSSYLINICMDEKAGDSSQKDDDRKFTWQATIYPPAPNGMGRYWKSTMAEEASDENE